MKLLPVEDAIGQVLCHDMTRIVKGTMKGAQFRKGHIVREEDIPMLLDMGKRHIYVLELEPGMLHENDAATRLAACCMNAGMRASEVSEGKIELIAGRGGLLLVDTERLQAVNMLDDIIIACRHNYSPVKAGDKLAGTRIIPLIIAENCIAEAERIAAGAPIFSLLPYTVQTACIITTGSEIASGRIADTFTPVVEEKLRAYGIEVVRNFITGDEPAAIRRALQEARALNPGMILCTGGMSVDPDDNTPGAIRQSGAQIITYGAPVLPGAMFLLGYYEDGLPVLGLPGCVMYAAATIFDIALPRIAAGVRMEKKDFAVMGNGGLCLGCSPCRYPICPFGKGE